MVLDCIKTLGVRSPCCRDCKEEERKGGGDKKKESRVWSSSSSSISQELAGTTTRPRRAHTKDAGPDVLVSAGTAAELLHAPLNELVWTQFSPLLLDVGTPRPSFAFSGLIEVRSRFPKLLPAPPQIPPELSREETLLEDNTGDNKQQRSFIVTFGILKCNLASMDSSRCLSFGAQLDVPPELVN